MEIFSIDAGEYKLDGGAIFGVVPKSLWSKVYPADENNLCDLSLRCLLLEEGDRRILVDTGIGSKQDEKFNTIHHHRGMHQLLLSLAQAGFRPEDITDVLFTHLHFDHCGGAVIKDAIGRSFHVFPQAQYWVSEAQWNLAMNPNPREKASFLKENILPLQDFGRLNLVKEEGSLFPGVDIRFFYGHTSGLMVPFIRKNNNTLVYVADLLPFAVHMPLAWVCGYDTQPLVSMQEKDLFLKEALEKDYLLYFEHDHYTECCNLQMTEKGIRAKDSFSLGEWMQ